MKITVVTVVFNGVDLIESTLRSVTSQDYEFVEFIVIDGRSSDGTSDVIRRYIGQIDTYICEPDHGIYDAMNKAIALASGEYTLFMNAGDTFYSENSISNLVLHVEDDCAVIYGDRNYIFPNGKEEIQQARPIETIFERMPYCHQSALISTNILREYSFNTTYKFAADYNQLVEIYLAGKQFKKISSTVCNYRAGGKSESGLRPYLEVLKIQFDNCSDKKILRNSVYFKGFKKNINKLLNI